MLTKYAYSVNPGKYQKIKSFSYLKRNFARWNVNGWQTTDVDGCSSEMGEILAASKKYVNLAKKDLAQRSVRMPHPLWSAEEVENVHLQHKKTKCFIDKVAFLTVKMLRHSYDLLSGYSLGWKDENACVNRVVILETVAGIPGMVGAAHRHFKSLRTMNPDYGFIHTLLEEAENERMHLMVALMLKKPSLAVKALVQCAQILFLVFYTTSYFISPHFCHRFVGYLEEEAVKTYTDIIKRIDSDQLKDFNVPAPKAAKSYWNLPPQATLRDVFNAIRADEAHHGEVNHHFSDIVKTQNAINPF